MQLFEIRHKIDGRTLYSVEADSLEDAILKAIEAKADLSSANLRSADLRSANLSSADLSSADLISANLSSADLNSADLSSADLISANLRSADLSSADLSSADLSSANLSSADLSSANLRSIRADFYEVLLAAPHEVPGLREALVEGRIDGTVYSGECACLVGTIAKLRQCDYTEIPGLNPDGARPAERWFLALRPGHTPENSQLAAITLGWIDYFLAQVQPREMAQAGA